MGASRRHRRQIARGRVSTDRLRTSALIGARLAGCTCTPDLEILRHGHISHMNVRHDTGCPAIADGARRQWLVLP